MTCLPELPPRSMAGLPIAFARCVHTVGSMNWTALRQRGLALGLGIGLTLVALWAAGVVLIAVWSAAHFPDRLATDGDPCCPVPDSWRDVAVWSVAAVLLGQ